MARIAVVHHNVEVKTGRLQPYLDRHERAEVWAPDSAFPSDVDAIVVMGGFMGAYETGELPWLADEMRWLASSVERSIPVLGICLGAQLLAHALGGRAYLAPRPEVGVVEMSLTAEGKEHPVTSALGERAFFAHQDTFDLPPDAVLLAETAAYPAAFELGPALGLQPHLEAPAAEAVTWPDHPDFDMLERVGVSREEYVSSVRRHDAEGEQVAAWVFSSWFDRL